MENKIIMTDGIVGANGENVENVRNELIKDQFNKAVKSYAEDLDSQSQQLKDSAKQLQLSNGLEILPMFGYALILPYDQNPFDVMRATKGGILIGNDGMPGQHLSQETGEIENDVDFVRVGVVVETGHKCEFLKQGDIVFYTKASEFPVPFYQQGFVIVNENRIVAVVNEGLSERKNEINK